MLPYLPRSRLAGEALSCVVASGTSAQATGVAPELAGKNGLRASLCRASVNGSGH